MNKSKQIVDLYIKGLAENLYQMKDKYYSDLNLTITRKKMEIDKMKKYVTKLKKELEEEFQKVF